MAANRVAWEDRLIQHVLRYIRDMTALVAPTETVYIAVDGVAPMAKIKQQRARRFKSAILAAEEAAVKAAALGGAAAAVAETIAAERWNTNAITPGTAFMARLGVALRGLRIAGLTVIASPADEAGEGEQKIMAWLRQQPTVKDTVVYGLDADLIVLAILEHARTGGTATVDLFREETEFGGGVKRDALGAEQYLYLQTTPLAAALYNTWAPNKSVSPSSFLRDFVGIMNLMGNDFVPHGMALKINDEGIEHVLEAAKRLTTPLTKEDGTYDAGALATLLEVLAAQEERWILRGIRRKLEARVGACATAKDPVARALAAMNDRPVQWAAEACLVEPRRVADAEKPALFLRDGWRDVYRAEALEGADVGAAVTAYCQALAWTMAYYIGKPVDMTWYYPWHLPPLLGDVALALRKGGRGGESLLETPVPAPNAVDLTPVEQLAMVLPVTSFDLLPAEMRDLPTKMPWAWPTAWPVFSLGRRFLWECEPRIPLVRPGQIRAALKKS